MLNYNYLVSFILGVYLGCCDGGLLTRNKCQSVTSPLCAIVYDDGECNGYDHWSNANLRIDERQLCDLNRVTHVLRYVFVSEEFNFSFENVKFNFV